MTRLPVARPEGNELPIVPQIDVTQLRVAVEFLRSAIDCHEKGMPTLSQDDVLAAVEALGRAAPGPRHELAMARLRIQRRLDAAVAVTLEEFDKATAKLFGGEA